MGHDKEDLLLQILLFSQAGPLLSPPLSDGVGVGVGGSTTRGHQDDDRVHTIHRDDDQAHTAHQDVDLLYEDDDQAHMAHVASQAYNQVHTVDDRVHTAHRGHTVRKVHSEEGVAAPVVAEAGVAALVVAAAVMQD